MIRGIFGFKLVGCLFVTLVTFPITGCSDFEDIGTTNVILAMGVDCVEDGKVEVSVEYFAPSEKSGGSSEPGGASGVTQVRSATGSTITEALDTFNGSLPRRLYFAHNTVFVFGRSFVEAGIEQAFDYLEKQSALRRNELLVMANGTAKDLLTATTSPERINAFGIRTIADQVGQQSPVLNSAQFKVMRSYLSPSHSMLLMKCDKDEQGGVQYSGIAVIQSGKLVLDLAPKSTLPIALASGPTHMVALTVPCNNKNSPVTGKDDIRLLRTFTRIEPANNGKYVDCTVKIRGQAEVERLCPGTRLSTSLIKEMEQATAVELERQVSNLIDTLQQTHVDAIGLGTLIFRKDPTLWKSMSSDYPDYMSNVRFHYDVRIQILRAGLSDNSPERAYSRSGTTST